MKSTNRRYVGVVSRRITVCSVRTITAEENYRLVKYYPSIIKSYKSGQRPKRKHLALVKNN